MKKAFTLIELLVVIVIVGFLAALLLPAFGRVRAEARKIECINNLRQIGAAFYLYLDEHNEIFPPGGGSPSSGQADQSWKEYLYPYIDNHGVFVCHASVTRTTWSWSGDTTATSTKNPYGYNGFLGGGSQGGMPKRLSEVKTPSRTILCVDATPGSGIVSLEGNWGGPIIEYRHTKGANILWVGGAVQWFWESEIKNNLNAAQNYKTGAWWGP